MVMWEVTSYGERPYWNLTNRDVSTVCFAVLRPHPSPPVPLSQTLEPRAYCFCAGDQIRGGGLQAARPHGLPRPSAHAHAGLLAEGPQREATLLPDSHRSRQAHPQPGEPQVHGHTLQVRTFSPGSIWPDVVSLRHLVKYWFV